MPRTSKAEAPVALDEPMIEGRYVELDDYTVGFETHKADLDPAPLFRGLQGDGCGSVLQLHDPGSDLAHRVGGLLLRLSGRLAEPAQSEAELPAFEHRSCCTQVVGRDDRR